MKFFVDSTWLLTLLLARSAFGLAQSSIAATTSVSGQAAAGAAAFTKPLSEYPSEPQFLTINSDYPELNVLHSEPWIFEVPHFLNRSEAQGLLRLCESRMQIALDSQGLRREGEGWEFENVRFDPRLVVPWLEARIKALTGLQYDCVSDATAMHYWPGSAGLPKHADHNHLTFFRGSGRVATLFIYLNDVSVEATGGTSFTEIPGGLIAQPSFGKAVLFFPGELNGGTDFRTQHAGLATDDEKWLLRFFFHAQPVFQVRAADADGGYDNGFHAFNGEGYHVRQVGSYDPEPPQEWVRRFEQDSAAGDVISSE